MFVSLGVSENSLKLGGVASWLVIGSIEPSKCAKSRNSAVRNKGKKGVKHKLRILFLCVSQIIIDHPSGFPVAVLLLSSTQYQLPMISIYLDDLRFSGHSPDILRTRLTTLLTTPPFFLRSEPALLTLPWGVRCTAAQCCTAGANVLL